MAVAVEVPHGHGTGTVPGTEASPCLEGAVAVAQQHAHRFVNQSQILVLVVVLGAETRDSEVEMAIAIKVPRRHGAGTEPGREVASRLKGTVTVAQQHTYRVAARVGHGEVEAA